MLSRENYSAEYIRALRNKTGADPILLERVIYAFGLLEAITQAGLPFIFKGGTSLMLLFNRSYRLSTDIDVVVDKGTRIDDFIQKAGDTFPFISVNEKNRTSESKIEKRHFQFKFCSPIRNRDVNVLLDVVFSDNPYPTVIQKPIENDLLLTEGQNLEVWIPNENCLLGDKLTAFAPRTTGIPFGKNKEMEIIKQLYDCGLLFDAMSNFDETKAVFEKTASLELANRGLSLTCRDVLLDIIDSCLCILGRGSANNQDYVYFKDGISRLQNHIMVGAINGEIAGMIASKILFLSTSMLAGKKNVERLTEFDSYINKKPEIEKQKRYSYLRLIDLAAYAYFVEATRLLNEIS